MWDICNVKHWMDGLPDWQAALVYVGAAVIGNVIGMCIVRLWPGYFNLGSFLVHCAAFTIVFSGLSTWQHHRKRRGQSGRTERW
jgi:uncharacterized membrane protein YfcA